MPDAVEDALREPPNPRYGTRSSFTNLIHAQGKPKCPNSLEDDSRCLIIACGTDRPCSFWDDTEHCTIYPTRPNVCVGMQAGDEQCQEARRLAGIEMLQPIESTSAE